MNTTSDSLPDDVDALKAALLAERAARREFEARASGAEAMVAHLKRKRCGDGMVGFDLTIAAAADPAAKPPGS